MLINFDLQAFQKQLDIFDDKKPTKLTFGPEAKEHWELKEVRK